MLSRQREKDLYKQGYRITGSNFAIKVCMWTKRAIKNEDFCYKQKFYGINSHRCVQMTPAMQFCNHRCCWCWRDIDFTEPKWKGKADDPKDIIEKCIKEHVRYLHGFGGNPKTNKEKYKEAFKPLHFAISLSGEPTFYPKLPELISELRKRKITSFLVSNGTNPSMLRKMIKNQPTQLYITLPAPDEETYTKVCAPLIQNGWKKINESLSLLKKFERSAIRLTLVKEVNMVKLEKYAKLIKKASPLFVEVKAYMHVGYSQQRLPLKAMPRHEEVKEFAEQIAKFSGYKIIDEKENSRVVLLMKKDSKKRIIKIR